VARSSLLLSRGRHGADLKLGGSASTPCPTRAGHACRGSIPAIARANLYEATFRPNRTTALQFESSVGFAAKKSVTRQFRWSRGMRGIERPVPCRSARNANPADRSQALQHVFRRPNGKWQDGDPRLIQGPLCRCCMGCASCLQIGCFADIHRFVGITLVDTVSYHPHYRLFYQHGDELAGYRGKGLF
jgi:hypothetical protein